MRKIAVRIDDISPDMDWERFRRFEELLARYRIRPLIGLIPDNLDRTVGSGKAMPEAEYRAWLEEKRREGWLFALHGWHHRYRTKQRGIFPLNPFSEFAGLPFMMQRSMIAKGKEKLARLGAETDIFMAPGHSFDKNTLRALKECGFRYITDGYGDAPYIREELVFLPISLLRSAELKRRSGFSCFVVHTAELTDTELEEYERLFSSQRSRFIDYRRLLRIKPRKRGLFGNTAEYLLALAKGLAGSLSGGGTKGSEAAERTERKERGAGDA
ncbi:MAG: DUF2334 domain-containing protein [Lachnospiraceae bacterium]|nr:DUF2334 domain-containing protein [Lachnospiraceae bacterium]